MALERCKKHGAIIPIGRTRCHMCEIEDSPKVTEADWISRLDEVIRFAEILKSKMVVGGNLVKPAVRAKCPEHPQTFIHARVSGPRNHFRMACEISGCRYWLME